jgi:hypothetical protein
LEEGKDCPYGGASIITLKSKKQTSLIHAFFFFDHFRLITYIAQEELLEWVQKVCVLQFAEAMWYTL